MRDPQLPPLRYLSAADVRAAMPPLPERLELAERTMTALVADAELPPKIGVHPRPAGSFAHAMPAWLRGAAEDGTADRLGIKWVSGFGAANAARGLPAIHAVVILGDAMTGVPEAILDGGPITAERTAAVSGVAIGRFAPVVTGRPVRAALIGAGVQGRSHLPVLGYLLPGVEIAIHDRHPERAEALADLARATPGVGGGTRRRDAARGHPGGRRRRHGGVIHHPGSSREPRRGGVRAARPRGGGRLRDAGGCRRWPAPRASS